MENPEFYQGGYYNSQFTYEKRVSAMEAKNAEHFVIDDLLDFPNDEGIVVAVSEGTTTTTVLDNSTITATGTSTTDSSSTANSSSFCATTNTHELLPHNFPGEDYVGCRNLSSSDPQFTSELCVPYDDLAELEWLSNFVEDSFSTEDLQKLQLISGMKTPPNNEPSPETHHHDDEEFQLSEPNHRGGGTTDATTYHHHPTIFRPETTVPAKARSKRSRAAPCNWTSRLLVVSPSQAMTNTTPTPTTTTSTVSSSSESDIATSSIGRGGGGGKKTVAKATPNKKKEAWENGSMGINGGEGRKCLHCATDKTPQWRTGPMGPKTLCNACGVRYKSGRLVPEYRPAASPTFVLTKHSNSHRKVLELRRQKEMIRAQSHHQQQQQQPQHQFLHQSMMFDVSNGDDYLIHQHIGPDFRQLI